MIAKRISKIQNHLHSQHRRQHQHQFRPLSPKTSLNLRVIPKGRVDRLVNMAAEIVNHFLVTQQKALEDLVPHWVVRWFLRWVYQHYGFAAMRCQCKHGITYFNLEHRATFSDPAEARYWANCKGGAYKPIPHNPSQPLPEQTAQYGELDYPQSEASADYRNRRLPFTVVPTYNLERLEEMRRRTDALVQQYRESA